MSEWSIEHAWKSTLPARADAHQIPPTHFRSTSSRNNDVARRLPVNHDVCPGLRGVCDTVLTQHRCAVTPMSTETHERVLTFKDARVVPTRWHHQGSRTN